MTLRPRVTRSRSSTCGWSTQPSPTWQSGPTNTWGWRRAPSSTIDRSPITANAPTVAPDATRAVSATYAVGWTPGAATGSGKNSVRIVAIAAYGWATRIDGRPARSRPGGAISAAAALARAVGRCRSATTKDRSPEPALSRLANPRISSDGSPSRSPPTRRESSPRDRPGILLLLRLLLIVELDDLVGDVRLRVPVDHAAAAALDDQQEAALLAHLLDDARQLAQDPLGRLLFLLLQLLLEVFRQPPKVAHLPLERLFLFPARLGRQHHTLLFHLLAELVHLDLSV